MLGGFSLLLGLPLFILIPVVLVALGVGLYMVITLLPVLVFGGVFVIMYKVCKWSSLREPYLYLLPAVLAFVSLLPMVIPQFKALGVSALASMQGVSAQLGLFETVDWLLRAPYYIFLVLLLAFILVGVISLRKFGRPGTLLAGFFSFAIVAMFIGQVMPLTEGLVEVVGLTEGTVASSDLPAILYVSLAQLGVGVVSFVGMSRRWW